VVFDTEGTGTTGSRLTGPINSTTADRQIRLIGNHVCSSFFLSSVLDIRQFSLIPCLFQMCLLKDLQLDWIKNVTQRNVHVWCHIFNKYIMMYFTGLSPLIP